MAAVSKNVYSDVLDNIFNKYNNTVHRTTKMKPIDVTSDSYPEYNEDSNFELCWTQWCQDIKIQEHFC